jgi:hypothetical protein
MERDALVMHSPQPYLSLRRKDLASADTGITFSLGMDPNRDRHKMHIISGTSTRAIGLPTLQDRFLRREEDRHRGTKRRCHVLGRRSAAEFEFADSPRCVRGS